MSEIVCVTNRKLCREDFLDRMEAIAKERPAGVILREKDLSEEAYRELAVSVTEICKAYGTPCILHTFSKVAVQLGAEAIHLSLPVLREMSKEEKKRFSVIGASCHSLPEAMEAERLGCTYLTAGHVFATDCKKGLPGRGTDFLRELCENVTVPVYGIGGIDASNYREVLNAGAKGCCIMSGLMRCDDVKSYMEDFTNEV